jgi:hypothetical protein
VRHSSMIESVRARVGVGLCTLALAMSPALAQDHDHDHSHDHSHAAEAPEGSASLGVISASEPPSRKELMKDLVGSNLVFEAENVSAGEILDLETVDVEFTFRNTGSEPLEIRYIKPSCGCTVPELEKTVYEPGERASMRVTLDPKGKNGSLSRLITVYTNSKIKPVHRIFVEANVKPVVITEPRFVTFTSVDKGEAATQTLEVLGRFPEFKVTRVTTSDPDVFDVQLEHVGEVERQGETLWLSKVHVTIRESARPDSHRTELIIRTNDERKSFFSTAAVARVVGDLDMSPVRVTLGRLEVGDEFESQLFLRSRSGKAFEIKAVTENIDAVDMTAEFKPVDPEKRDKWSVLVKGTVIHPAHRFNAPFVIATDVADEELVRVNMYGQFVGSN